MRIDDFMYPSDAELSERKLYLYQEMLSEMKAAQCQDPEYPVNVRTYIRVVGAALMIVVAAIVLGIGLGIAQ